MNKKQIALIDSIYLKWLKAPREKKPEIHLEWREIENKLMEGNCGR